MRGPLVYCFEGVDNDGDVLSVALKRDGEMRVSRLDDGALKGVDKITVGAVRKRDGGSLYSDVPPEETEITAVAVPYYIWGNRGENQMRVWMDEIR